jgi:hypothetical protein
MGEVWMHFVAPIYDGKLEDFKRLAQDLLSIREKDPDALNHASFLDESARVAVFLEHHASSAAGSCITRTSTGWCRVPEVCEFSVIELHGDPAPEARGTRRDRPGYVVLSDALGALTRISTQEQLRGNPR